jgi:hypothetical protein
MNKKRRPLIIAVFDDSAHGQQAVNDLHRAGLSEDQVRLRKAEVEIEWAYNGNIPDQEAK